MYEITEIMNAVVEESPGLFTLITSGDWDGVAQHLSNNVSQTMEAYRAHMWNILWTRGVVDTVYMVGWAVLFAMLFGLVVGFALYLTQPGGLYSSPKLNRVIGVIVNVGRSIPIIVLIILLFPLSRIIVGTSIGRTASVVPLAIAAIPFMSRVIEAALNELGRGVIEAAVAAGASPRQIIFRVILPESAPALVSGLTLMIINLITFSAMAGVIGGGGLGQQAHIYGLSRFRTDVLVYTIILFIIMVQIVQAIGQYISRKLDKR